MDGRWSNATRDALRDDFAVEPGCDRRVVERQVDADVVALLAVRRAARVLRRAHRLQAALEARIPLVGGARLRGQVEVAARGVEGRGAEGLRDPMVGDVEEAGLRARAADLRLRFGRIRCRFRDMRCRTYL